MKRISFWPLFVIIMATAFACNNSSENTPVPEDSETIITIGNKEDLSVLSLNDELELLSNDQDEITFEIDIDGDQSNDLTLSSSKIDEQTQLILINSTDELQVSFASSLFFIDNLAFNYLSLVEEGVELKKDDFDWSSPNQQLLLAYRSLNSFSTPYPSPLRSEDVFLPIYDGKRLGWLTFNLFLNESNLRMETLSLKEFVYTTIED